MQISFAALEQALAPIEQVGQGEITFDVGSVPVTLRLLTPEEEVEVQKYANQALDEEGSTVPTEYVDRMKLSLLAYAVAQVGDQDLRQVEFVETGEKLDNGKPIKEPRHLAMRKIIKRWTAPTRTGLFRSYSDLVIQVEQKAEAAFKYTPMDLKTEIERLEKRVSQLKKELENQTKSTKNPFSEMVKTVSEVDAEEKQAREQDMDAHVAKSQAPEAPAPQKAQEPPAAPQERRSIIPQAPAASPPPVRLPEAPRPPVTVSVPDSPRQPVVAAAPEVAPPPAAPKYVVPDEDDDGDSFTDLSDPDRVQRAMDAETRRLLESRRLAGGRPAPAVGGPTRRPPHADALETEESLMRQASEEKPIGDRPVYRLPPQELGVAQQGPVPNKVPTDQVTDRSARNPHFRKSPLQG
jgi:hypothetical protein